MTKNEIDINLLELPLYTYAEADYLASTSRGTAKRWLTGYQFKSTSGKTIQRPPVTSQPEREPKGVSFTDLIELVAIGGLKDMGLTLLEIRRVVRNCEEVLGAQRPLTSLSFKVGGREVFASHDGTLVEVLRGRARRAWQEVLEPFLETLDYHGELARRWWPLGRHAAICVDPDYGYGLPVIHRTGVRTEIILERFQAGDSRELIAEDFNVDALEVDSALRFEASRFKSAA